MDKRHIINLQGRDFVTYEGLLDEAHKQGLRSIRTALVQLPSAQNDQTAICTAEIELAVNGEIRVFTGIGDASPRNVSRGVALHLIRMAETRAKARAMRDAVNVGITAFEEMEDAELPREAGDGFKGSQIQLTAREAKPAVDIKGAGGLASKAQIDKASREMTRTGFTPEQGRAYLNEHFNKASRLELTADEIEIFLAHLKKQPDASRAV